MQSRKLLPALIERRYVKRKRISGYRNERKFAACASDKMCADKVKSHHIWLDVLNLNSRKQIVARTSNQNE